MGSLQSVDAVRSDANASCDSRRHSLFGDPSHHVTSAFCNRNTINILTSYLTLTKNDQLRHGNQYEEGMFLGQPRH